MRPAKQTTGETKRRSSQGEQKALVGRALEIPGVAEAMAAYERISKLDLPVMVEARPRVTYATGANRA